MNFVTNEFKDFREDFNIALRTVAGKYALTIKAGNISYNNDTFSFKVVCAKTDAGDIKQRDFERYCAAYGFTKDDYNREFVFNGEKYAFTEISVKSHTYPCIAVNLNNKKQYKFTADCIKQALKKK